MPLYHSSMRCSVWHNTGQTAPLRLRKIGCHARNEVSDCGWSAKYGVLAEADKVDEAARRLRLKASTLASRSVPLEQESRLVADKLALEQQDTLATALQELQVASAAEQYAAAARLRDEAYAWLGGWWRVADGKQQLNRLLHVGRKSHGRWTGRIFSAVDFIHYDVNKQPEQAGADIDMKDLLADPRYGTPLFEVFVLRAQPNDQQDHDPNEVHRTGDSSSSSSSSEDKDNSPNKKSDREQLTSGSSHYSSLVIALQSVNRAINEVLQIDPAARAPSRSSDSSVADVRTVNQRILLVLQPDRASAVAVHAGNDQTLWKWTASLPSQQPLQSSVDSMASEVHSRQHTAELGDRGIQLTAHRVSECAKGMLVPSLSIDWHEVDLLRGPGSVERTAPNSFMFTRHRLPGDVLISMIGPNSINSREEAADSSCKSSVVSETLRLFCVNLQYLTESAEGSLPVQGAGAGDCSTGTSESIECDIRGAQPDWAMRVATEIMHLTQQSPHQQQQQPEAPYLVDLQQDFSFAGDSQVTGQITVLGELLSAAAAGCAPSGGAVSELMQPVSVREVIRPDSSSSTSSNGQLEQSMRFERIADNSVTLSFGGWEVQAWLPSGSSRR